MGEEKGENLFLARFSFGDNHLALNPGTSLPHRQLRNAQVDGSRKRFTSLPHRQLRKYPVSGAREGPTSLPH
ncbi:MAG: hypothetical protein K2W33_09790, partial [Burkholderiales bacterium]|nr:hypothetical protein [Burkholderiales bacterium]